MRTIAAFSFPESHEEALVWVPLFEIRRLDRNVLAVAKTRIEGAWRAYIAAVPGKNHDEEWEAVWQQGCPLMKDVANAIFPQFKELPYAS